MTRFTGLVCGRGGDNGHFGGNRGAPGETAQEEGSTRRTQVRDESVNEGKDPRDSGDGDRETRVAQGVTIGRVPWIINFCSRCLVSLSLLRIGTTIKYKQAKERLTSPGV